MPHPPSDACWVIRLLVTPLRKEASSREIELSLLFNDYDFERIDKYWKEISVKEFEELGNLGSINIQEWKLIEEAFG